MQTEDDESKVDEDAQEESKEVQEIKFQKLKIVLKIEFKVKIFTKFCQNLLIWCQILNQI